MHWNELEEIETRAAVLRDGGIHWWDYDKIPILAGMIVALARRLRVMEKTDGGKRDGQDG